MPPPLPQWIALAMPFQLEVWIFFVASVLVTVAFFTIYTIIDPNAIFKTNDVWLYIVYIIFDESFKKFTRVRYHISKLYVRNKIQLILIRE